MNSIIVIYGRNGEQVYDLAKTMATFSGAALFSNKVVGWSDRAMKESKVVIADMNTYLSLDAMYMQSLGFKGKITYLEMGGSWILK